jgi:serine/threonine protein kinase
MHNFYQEATIIMNFDHENILSCLGISTESLEAPYLIFEFMQFGDLTTILRQIKEKDLSTEFLPLNQVTILLNVMLFNSVLNLL